MTKEKIECLHLLRDTADQIIALNEAKSIASKGNIITFEATQKLTIVEQERLIAETGKVYSDIISKRLSELEKQLNNLVKSWQSMGR